MNHFAVNEPEVRNQTLKEVGTALDRHSARLNSAQQYLAGRLAIGTMADWTWGADMSPNQERKYANPTTSKEVADLIAQAAADFARSRPENTTSAMNELAVSPEAHSLRAQTLQAVRLHLDRRARGQ